MTTVRLFRVRSFAMCRVTCVTLTTLLALPVQAAIVPPGDTKDITDADPRETWVLNPGSTLNSDRGNVLDVFANNSVFNANDGSSNQIRAQLNSTVDLDGMTVLNSNTFGAAIRVSNSTADISRSQITSNDIGLELVRVNTAQTGSTVSLTDGTSVVAVNGGAFLTGRSQLNMDGSTIEATGASSYGVRLTNAHLNATDSSIVGGVNGVQVGKEQVLTSASSVTLDQTRVEGRSGAAIVVGYQGRPDVTATVNVLNNSQLIGANSNILEVNDGAHVDLTVDRSALAGNVVVAEGSTTQAVFQNGASLQGNLQNVSRVSFDQSAMTGDVLALAGSAATVQLSNSSNLAGNVDNVERLLLDSDSVMTGNVRSDTNGSVLLDNRSTLNGNVNNVSDLSLRNGSVLTGDVNTAVDGIVNLDRSALNGEVNNAKNLSLDRNSVMTGEVKGGADTVLQLDNGSAFNGTIRDTSRVALDNGSVMNGDVASNTGGAVLLDNASSLTGRIDNTTNLTINNAAQWVMTGDSSVQNLALKDGIVRMGTNEPFRQLNVGDLSGTGTFVMGTDLSNGHTDFLNVTGNASGQHRLQVAASGAIPLTAEPVKIGNIAAGDASFALADRETVDAGTFVYRLAKEGEGLYLNPDKETVSTSTNTALALAGSARSVLNAEMSMLSDQLGDRSMSIRPESGLRAMDDSSAKNLSNSVWVRSYGNQYNVANAYGDGYTQNQTGITGGADTTVDLGGRDWVVGGFVGTSRTNMDLRYGSSATVDSVNAGVYGSTYDAESGIFVNLMGKVNQFHNKAKVTMSDGVRAKGDNKALGVSGSVAVGKHIRLKDDYFLEPQVQLSTGVTQSDEYRLDNGLQVESDTMRSVQGKLGIRGGRVITLAGGALLEPSLLADVNHEFVKTNEVKINDDSFDDDRASSSLGYGAGLKWTAAQRNWQVAGEVGGSKGNTVSQDWSGSMRLSYFY